MYADTIPSRSQKHQGIMHGGPSEETHHLQDLHSGPLTSSTRPTLRPPGGGPPLPPLPLLPPKPQPGRLPGV